MSQADGDCRLDRTPDFIDVKPRPCPQRTQSEQARVPASFGMESAIGYLQVSQQEPGEDGGVVWCFRLGMQELVGLDSWKAGRERRLR